MATKTKKSETIQTTETENVTASTQDEATAQSKYSVDELTSKARELFNVAPYIVSAALDRNREYTVADAKKTVEDFAKKEVKI